MSLLHFFCKSRNFYNIPFVVAHVNHGLRKESEEEESFLKKHCDDLNIPIEILHVSVSETKPKGKSIEEYARDLRYEFFDKVRARYGYTHIVTAHNADDNSETVLLNLIRGSGLGGISGIPIKREDFVIRPLLYCSKEEIYSYCEEYGIRFFTDKTNFENIYTRNIIRNEIIPIIKKINPEFNRAVSRLTKVVSADNEYLGGLADIEVEKFSSEEAVKTLPLAYLRSMSDSLLSRFIRKFFFVNSPNIVLTNQQTNDIIYLIKNSTVSKKLSFSGVDIVLGYESLTILSAIKKHDISFDSELCLGDNVIPGVGIITVTNEIVDFGNDKDFVSEGISLRVRNRRSGDTVKFPKRPEKKLKKLFTDDKIPLSERMKIPIVVCNNEVVWIGGYGSCEKYRPHPGERAIKLNFKSF